MRRVLVTGGAGFIGSHITEALVQRGDHVRVIDNLSSGCLNNLAAVSEEIEFFEGSIDDESLVEKCLEGVDCIFHEAALASVPRSVEHPLETHAACVTGTVVLLDRARRAGVRRVVYAASSSAYGNQGSVSNLESEMPSPLSPYAAAKLAAEHYCHAFYHTYALETVCLRYFNVFGPRQDPGSAYSAVIPLFITAMLHDRQPTIYGDGHQSRDFTFIDNVVHGNLLAAEAEGVAGRTLNLANGESTSLLELIASLNKTLKMNITPLFDPPRIGDVRDSKADITLARQLLGYEPLVGFDEGLQRSIDYYRSIVESK